MRNDHHSTAHRKTAKTAGVRSVPLGKTSAAEQPLSVVPSPAGDAAVPISVHRAPRPSAWEQVLNYQIDRWQRSVLFLDTLRERANNLLAHEDAGLPPLLDFEYELILDARRFERPANYALLRITYCHGRRAEDLVDERKPPVIIVDPRAGHGPGIGGFKHESEVGMAMREGHPTYFVMFFPVPVPEQTLADVLHALQHFVEEVNRRHAGAAPVLYGNCQAGWAVALLAAGCQGLAGPTVLNGSPLSYWAGQSDVNPMRLAGGLVGGSWVTHWLADLGNGRFDGAWLVHNFEQLNPANTLWDKHYRLFAQIDTERERFLEFERWWTGYYFLTRQEILAIVENLFIGNKLERGVMQICDCCYVDLKRIRHPLVIFASSGDNITPPHQALNWIPTVYPTTAHLKEAGQRIIYLLNPHVGHLGIFVSAGVAKREHRAILQSLAELDRLEPGLYEMKIDTPADDERGAISKHAIRFEERQVEQLRYAYPADAFDSVRVLSEWNEQYYKGFISPWLRAMANPISAHWLKWLHPMRLGPALYSDKLNPCMLPVRLLAPFVGNARLPLDPGNQWLAFETVASDTISLALDSYRMVRDATAEQLFTALYGGRPSAPPTERATMTMPSCTTCDPTAGCGPQPKKRHVRPKDAADR